MILFFDKPRYRAAQLLWHFILTLAGILAKWLRIRQEKLSIFFRQEFTKHLYWASVEILRYWTIIVILPLYQSFHSHGEAKFASFLDSIWFNLDLTAAWFDDLLNKHEPKSDTDVIILRGLLQFSKASEQFGEVFSGDPASRILHAHFD